jgi:hypothetical protein
MSLTSLDKWLKKTTPDDTGLTRPPVVYYFIYCETPPVNYFYCETPPRSNYYRSNSFTWYGNSPCNVSKVV